MTALLEPPAARAVRPPAPSALRSGLTLFVAGRVAARTARRLGAQGDGTAAQEAVYRERLAALARTGFGREHGLGADTRYADFAARVPLRTYEATAPWIERMKRGEADVLAPGRCAHYAVSSGTTAGPSKYLPVNAAMLWHFRDAGLDSLFCYAARAGHSRVFLGRHLFLGGATSLQRLPGDFPAWAGDLSGITAMNLPVWARRQLYEPGEEIAQIADWPEKLRAIAARTYERNLTLVAGIPSWLLVFAEAMRAAAAGRGRRLGPMAELWPNLECLIHGGVPLAPFAERLRESFGAQVGFHEVYPASEGFIAVQDAAADEGLRLLADRGIFYEFLPMSDYRGAADPAALGECAVPLAGVKPDTDYALVMTTPAGLTRYLIGDVVRFAGTRPPRLFYAGRTRLELSAFGEHVIERELTDVVTAVCADRGLALVDFHVAPLFPDPAAGRPRGAHEWWIELAPGGWPADPAGLAAALDAGLARSNDDYAAKRAGGGMLPPVVRLAPRGLFEAWLKQAGKWGGQNKLPRCRSDRQVAEALAALTGQR